MNDLCTSCSQTIDVQPAGNFWTKPLYYLCYMTGALLTIALVVSLICFSTLENKNSMTNLGIAGDMIILDETSNWLDSQWSARECLESGDYYKISDLSILRKDDLIQHEYVDTYQSREFFQSHQSRQTGMINTPGLYLLAGSSINYTLCIATDGQSEESGVIYIFDSREFFYAFIDESDDGEHSSVYKANLPVGANNRSICTQIIFVVAKEAYYYVTAETPGGVFYHFTANVHAMYLNSTDYVWDCKISGSEDCRLKIPKSLSNNKYVLLAYIHPVLPFVPEPLSTHLCSIRKRWWAIPAILGILTGTVTLLLISVASLHFYKCFCNRRRYGYHQILSDIDVQGS